MRSKTVSTALAVITILAAGSVQAAVINLADYSLTPDGQNLATTFQNTNVNTLNSGSVLPASGTPTVYVVSTFTFGTDSNAHLQWQFYVNETSAPRIGIEVNDDGLIQTIGTGNGQLLGNGTPKRTTVNLTQDMAGQTITLLAKLHYDATLSDTYQATSNGVTPTNSDDTLMNVWINPTSSSVEGSGLSAGDLYALWNSAGFNWFRQTIQNQNTPGTAGDSLITNTVILTGDDATFANALAFAVPPVPEPGTLVLLALGGLVGLLIVRRRMK